MLEAYEVFDASNEELLSELQSLQQLLRTASGPHHVEYKMLYDTVRQELEERGVSNKVFQQLVPAVVASCHVAAPTLYGLPSPGPFAPAAFAAPPAATSTAVVQQSVQPVAALYSFGSFGTGGGGAAAAAAAAAAAGGMSYGHGSYSNGGGAANGSIAQAVNAMVTATARHAQCAVPSGAGGVSVASARPPPPPAALTSEVPPPPVPMQALLRNHDTAAGAPTAQTSKQQAQPTPRPQPAALQLPSQVPSYGHTPTQPALQTSTPNPTTAHIMIQTQPHAQGTALPSPSPAAGPQPSPGAASMYTFVRHRHNSGDGGGRSMTGPSSCSSGDEGGWMTDSTMTPTPTGANKARLAGPETSSSVVEGNGAAAPAADGSGLAAGAGAGGESGGGGGGGKQLSPWEAAMLAFQEEQRLIRKARTAIRKGQPAKPGPKKRPAAAAAPHPHGQHPPPPPLAAESSHGATRPGGGARAVRPSATGSSAGLPAAAAHSGGCGSSGANGHGAAGQGVRGGGATSPHGAAALVAGSAVAAAAAAGAAGRAAGQAPAAAAAAHGAASGGSKAGGGGPAGNPRGAAPAGGKAAAGGAVGGGGAAGGQLAQPGASTRTAAAAANAPCGADADADAVPEEQGLAARTQAVPPAEVADRPRPPSEPESVKTDEDSSDMVAAAMREAAAAKAAAPGGGGAASSSSDSDPESVSSSCSQERPNQQPQHQQQNHHQEQRDPGSPPAAAAVRPCAHTAPAGPVGQQPSAAQLRTMSASQPSSSATYSNHSTLSNPQHAAPAAATRPGQPTLVASSSRTPAAGGPAAAGVGTDAAAAAAGPRRAWGPAAPQALSPPAASASPRILPQRPSQDWAAPAAAASALAAAANADTVPTESGSESTSDSDGGSSRSAGFASPGRLQYGRPVSRSHPLLSVPRPESAEEARQRAIAAAAAAAIQGRAASDASVYVGSANQLARAVVNSSPLKVDRWADWDLADSSDALSAWATNHEEDPMRGGALRAPLRPTGHMAPPESLVTGPPGVHALPAVARPVGSASASRQGSRQGVGSQGDGVLAPPVRAGSAPHGGRGAAATATATAGHAAGAAASSGRAGSDSHSDGDSDGDGSDGAGSGRGTVRQGGGPSPPPPPLAPLPRSGVVMAGSKASAFGASGGPGAAAAPAASAPTAPVRRPPLAPAAPAAPASAGRPGGVSSTPGLPRSGGGSWGNLSTAAAGAPNPSASDSSAAPSAASTYLQCYSAFHEILTLCYSALPVMLDAAALSSASVATVAGGGGSGSSSSRPPSRILGSAAASSASGFDLMERYANLLARCEAWQAKLRQLTGAMPEDGGTTAGPSLPLAPSPLGAQPGQAQAQGQQWAPSSAAAAATASEQQPLPPPTARRYVAVYDDTAHPEVRNVVVAAMRLLPPGWALDPADQVTEVAKPEVTAPDDDAGGGGGGGGGSCSSSRPATALFGGGGGATASSRAGTPASASVWGGLLSSNGNAGCWGGSNGGAGSGAGGGGGGGGGGGSVGCGGGGGVGPRCSMWNVLWSWSVKVRVPINELLVWQRVNHFAEARQLTRKDLLKKHLAKYQAMHNTGRSAALFDRLTPTTFVLPKEAAAFEEAFVRALHGVEPTCVQPMGLNLWIQKPVGLSRGRGISLLNSLRQLNTGEPMVVQRYLTDPLLVEGYKFDLRLYVLVTSFNPLEAWMYDEGFARFTTLPYTLDEAELGNMHVHLTNSSVQKTRAEMGQLPAFLQAAEPAGGSKTSLATLRRLLSRHGVDWPLLWSRICEVATAALFAAQDAIPHSPNSFELFGFDMMIDAEQKVWLLEVNSSPSMGLDTPLDVATKPRLIADVMELLAPLPFDREALAGVLRTRTTTGRGGRRGLPGLLSGTASEERELCCADLQAVLGGAVPRRYGEKPRNPGGFTTCLAPSAFHDRLLKLRRPLP